MTTTRISAQAERPQDASTSKYLSSSIVAWLALVGYLVGYCLPGFGVSQRSVLKVPTILP